MRRINETKTCRHSSDFASLCSLDGFTEAYPHMRGAKFPPVAFTSVKGKLIIFKGNNDNLQVEINSDNVTVIYIHLVAKRLS